MGLSFRLGLLCGIFLSGCASFTFVHYYGMSEVNYQQGKLLGPTPQDDLPFQKCAPSESSKFPCVIMLTGEFFALKQDYEDTKAKLDDCERGQAPHD